MNGGPRDCLENCSPASCQEYPCEELSGDRAPFYVYVAGPLSGDPGQYLANVSAMSTVCRMLLDRGFCPINPAGDLIEGLTSPLPLPVLAYQRRSLELLRLLAYVPRAALFVISAQHSDGRRSSGVAAEIAMAAELGIPTFFDLEQLLEMRRDS